MSHPELAYPPVAADLDLVRAFFRQQPVPLAELRNPHIEPRVSAAVKATARQSAVLIPLLEGDEPRILVTRRHAKIRFSGHICFPGGTRDTTDLSLVDTALRETEEEINLDPAQVTVLGCLPDYFTQMGYRITPVVGVVAAGAEVRANPDEVDEIYQVSLGKALNAANYGISWRTPERGHFAFEEQGIRIAGPTVSMMIGFYELLLDFTGALPGAFRTMV